MKQKIDSIQKKARIKSEKKKVERDLRKPFEYVQFVKWTALPSVLRKPQTQRDLSKEFRVDEDTLTNWKKREKFWDEVRDEMRKYFQDKTSNVVQALYQTILSQGKGTAQGAKLWLEYINQWIPKQENINRDKTLEDLIDDAKKDKQQNTDREPALDTKQTGKKTKVHSKSDTKLLPGKENAEGSDTKSEAERV